MAAVIAESPSESSSLSSTSPSPSSSSSSLPSASSLTLLEGDLVSRFASHAKKTKALHKHSSRSYALPEDDEPSSSLRLVYKLTSEYAAVRHLPQPASATVKPPPSSSSSPTASLPSSNFAIPAPKQTKQIKRIRGQHDVNVEDEVEEATTVLSSSSVSSSSPSSSSSSSSSSSGVHELLDKVAAQSPASLPPSASSSSSTALILASSSSSSSSSSPFSDGDVRLQLIVRRREMSSVRPVWHAPWKLMRVIPGHQGWVRCIDVDCSNDWFVTGSADRTIKIWDLASGQLRLTLTGHVSSVRDVVVSNRHPYLFSCGEDHQVKCWDLEQNKVVRQYHGHLSGVYSLALHPSLDVLVSGGRDSTARVWDMRTKTCVSILAGHTNTVGSVVCQNAEPQVITGSHDSQIKLWDLATGKCRTTLTHHKKSVRGLAIHPEEYTFVSGAADNIKIWKCPEGTFLRNAEGHNAIVNSVAVNRENVLVSAADNGSIQFWDWKSAYCFQQHMTVAQPGSLESERGIFQVQFDQTGSRLFTVEADKTIKVYKEDENATEETHPIDFKPTKKRPRY